MSPRSARSLSGSKNQEPLDSSWSGDEYSTVELVALKDKHLGKKKNKNPFVVPSEQEVIAMQEEKREAKVVCFLCWSHLCQSLARMKVHQKSTASFRNSSTRLKFGDIDGEEPPEEQKQVETNKNSSRANM
jgi:hypothetical protein